MSKEVMKYIIDTNHTISEVEAKIIYSKMDAIVNNLDCIKDYDDDLLEELQDLLSNPLEVSEIICYADRADEFLLTDGGKANDGTYLRLSHIIEVLTEKELLIANHNEDYPHVKLGSTEYYFTTKWRD